MTEHLSDAVRVARMYYYQERTTQEIAGELGLSRSKVSRLLKLAKAQGLVEIRIIDPNTQASALEGTIQTHFGVPEVHVVDVPETASEREWLERVATVAAAYLSTLMKDGTILATAWGTTVSAISERLGVKPLKNVQVVQLNGSGNTHDAGLLYSAEILRHFSEAYGAKTHTFPVPTFFDYPETKGALWRERSVRRILDLQARADILLYSIGAFEAGVPSHVYTGGYLEPTDLTDLKREGVVGDIATVFFRADGSYRDIPINARASGPDLSLFTQAENAVCVVSGRGKAAGLRAALAGGYLKKLIIDEPTARMLSAGLEATRPTSGAKPRT
jgi:deoxyribonucleoside regulator